MTRQITRIKSVSQYHQMLGLPKPMHPLISIINMKDISRPLMDDSPFSIVFDYYSIALKKDFHVKMRYGQQPHDFDEGVLGFMAPGQLLTVEFDKNQKHDPSGWMILIHPDFLWNTSLAKKIRQYEFFDYAVNEALHLSDKEESMLTAIVQNMEQEYHTNIDKFSQPVIIAQLELLLTYSERFYQRQFITRKVSSHELLDRFETLVLDYFKSGSLAIQGLPTVTYIADALHVSPNYLSGLLKTLTGQTAQQHLHDKLIELAKIKLSTTNLTVGEIAYELGFEHLQSFSKLFKTKTEMSPLEFRQSFN